MSRRGYLHSKDSELEFLGQIHLVFAKLGVLDTISERCFEVLKESGRFNGDQIPCPSRRS